MALISKVFLSLYLCGLLSSCALTQLLDGEDSILLETEETSNTEAFQDLLKSGWELKVFKGKVVLIKETNNEILIKDIFNTLAEE